MKNGLNNNTLKIVALIAMTIDHIAWFLYPGFSHELIPIIMHIIGRIAFPIFAYCVAEGYEHTHDFKKYAKRLFLFALISHIPYMLRSSSFIKYGYKCLIPFMTGSGPERFVNQTSVIWSYFIGLILIKLSDDKEISKSVKILLMVLLCIIALPANWNCIGSLVVLCIHKNKNNSKKQISLSFALILTYALVYFFAADKLYGLIQLGVLLSLPIIMLYNGERGSSPVINKVMKWIFYIYYPLHLLILGLIRIVLLFNS